MNFNGAYIGSSEDYLVSFDLETFRTDGLSGVFQDVSHKPWAAGIDGYLM